jgi:hypothetical protein
MYERKLFKKGREIRAITGMMIEALFANNSS